MEDAVARPEITGRRISDPAGRCAFSVTEFCESHRISRAHYYNLRKLGLGPDEARAGERVIITIEAAARWRRQREKAARFPPVAGA
jgi:hypothetical protein